jgi:phosphoserine phosphatase RsbU/P
MSAFPQIRLKITGKILLILLGLSILSLILFSTIAVGNMIGLGGYSLETNKALGNRAVSDSSEALKKQAEEQLLTLAIDQATISNGLFDKVESEVNVAASYISNVWNNPLQFPGRHIYYQNEKPDTIYTSSVTLLAPGITADSVKGDLELCSKLDNIFIPTFQNDNTVTQLYMGTESGIAQLYPWANTIPASFDPRQREWYIKAKQSRTMGWTNTMVDAVGGQPLITCFKPVYDAKRNLIGVIGADVTIETINQKIINTQVGQNGYAFLIDQTGRVIAHPSMQASGLKWNETMKTENLSKTDSANLAAIVTEMTAGNAGISQANIDGGDKYIAYAPVMRTGWSIGIVMPIAEIIAPIEKTRESIDSATAAFSAKTNNQIDGMLLTLILTSAGMVIAVAAAAYWLSRRITKPIVALNKGVQVIGRGDLEHRLDVRTGDEIEDLAVAFNKMANDLQEYIRDLKETTSAKERIESELRVANEIQSSMLPRLFPPFPDRKEFDLYATMNAAREVGGDFYDFFFVNPDKLCIIIGDVCGKGIPAALFMAISKTLLRTEALHAGTPDEVLLRVNDILYPDNEASMFFTGLCAMLDTNSGDMVIANGGHNPPLFCPDGQEFHYIQLPKGLVVGAMPGTRYESRSYTLKPHDTIFLYTDGVTEAMNPRNQLYSEARLLKCLNGLRGNSVSKMIHGVRADIDIFAEGAVQSDDITMLALEFNGCK